MLLQARSGLTGDTRKIFVSNIRQIQDRRDESNSACVLIGCKPIRSGLWLEQQKRCHTLQTRLRESNETSVGIAT